LGRLGYGDAAGLDLDPSTAKERIESKYRWSNILSRDVDPDDRGHDVSFLILCGLPLGQLYPPPCFGKSSRIKNWTIFEWLSDGLDTDWSGGLFGLALFEGLIWLTRPFSIWLLIVTFLVGGLYQLSPLKEACLRHCRTPLSVIAEFSGRRGRAIDLRLGLYHGMICVACCWGLMVILLAVGVMDLPAMIGLAAVTLIEKLTPFGLRAGRLVGWAFISTAVVITIWPGLIPITGAYLCRAP
jgi:Predicted metal-binding integral membrane protein (DUF2182)